MSFLEEGADLCSLGDDLLKVFIFLVKVQISSIADGCQGMEKVVAGR